MIYKTLHSLGTHKHMLVYTIFQVSVIWTFKKLFNYSVLMRDREEWEEICCLLIYSSKSLGKVRLMSWLIITTSRLKFNPMLLPEWYKPRCLGNNLMRSPVCVSCKLQLGTDPGIQFRCSIMEWRHAKYHLLCYFWLKFLYGCLKI